jgi:photosystem II stability/assembly factor-like uncharacterized protein
MRFFLLVCHSAVFLTGLGAGEQNTASDWHPKDPPFRVLNATSNGPSFWICGASEGIGVSSDAGEHWQVKHQSTDGAVLLNIDFANDKFGYAAGTGGVFLTTKDGGETWSRHSTTSGTILQVSFSDMLHGLIRTFTSLLFTSDGGSHWSVVSTGPNSEDIKHFPYTFSLVALDTTHMAVMLKEGSAQYESQGFLVTEDSGKSWKFLKIPNVTLYSFLRVQGKYWTIGTEVIQKDQPGGGHAVPVALYSSSGEKWEHSNNDLSACKPQMCVACKTEGCLSANGMIADFFSDKTIYKEFSPNGALTSKWVAAGSVICFVGNRFQCAGLKPTINASAGENPLPTVVGPGPLGAAPTQGPQCLTCSLDRILIDKKAEGAYTIKLVLEIEKTGIVRSALAEGAPTPEIKSSRMDIRALLERWCCGECQAEHHRSCERHKASVNGHFL